MYFVDLVHHTLVVAAVVFVHHTLVIERTVVWKLLVAEEHELIGATGQ